MHPDQPRYQAPQAYPQQPGGGYPPHGQQQWGPPPAPPAPARRRRVWPWVLLGAVLVPILGFVACTAMVGGAISAVDQQRQGGTVAIGETFTYASGLALTVALPVPYDAGNEFIIGADEQGYEAAVTITNGTDRAVDAVLISMNATVGNAPASQVFDDAFLPTQDIAPGQQLVVPFRFKVPQGTTGLLQIAVTDTFNEPVFFNAQLG